MILGVGVDLCEIGRVVDALDRHGQKFERRVCSARERLCMAPMSLEQRAVFVAERFASKEACAKALGTGIGRRARWHDIEVLPIATAGNDVLLSGKALKRARRLVADAAFDIRVDIVRRQEWVVAFATLQRRADP